MLAAVILVMLVVAVVLAARAVPARTVRPAELEAEDWPEHDEHP